MDFDHFSRFGSKVTEPIRVGCDFLFCHGGSAKYQTCSIFQQHSTICLPHPLGNHRKAGTQAGNTVGQERMCGR